MTAPARRIDEDREHEAAIAANRISRRDRREAAELLGAPGAQLTRRQVAAVLRVHPDSVTRLMHEGLASAVLEWGGRGREQVFFGPQVLRWRGARACLAGISCRACADAMFCSIAVAEHLTETRHGLFGCAECHSTWIYLGRDWRQPACGRPL